MSMMFTPKRIDCVAQRGVMLLEALISIAIFSIAVLGLIGLQSAAIRNTSEARQRAVAAFYANQIIGQMWANSTDLTSYAHFDEAGTTECPFSGEASGNEDVKAWRSALGGDLSGAVARGMQQIKVDRTTKVVNVTVCWKNPGESVFHWLTTVAQIKGPLDTP